MLEDHQVGPVRPLSCLNGLLTTLLNFFDQAQDRLGRNETSIPARYLWINRPKPTTLGHHDVIRSEGPDCSRAHRHVRNDKADILEFSPCGCNELRDLLRRTSR